MQQGPSLSPPIPASISPRLALPLRSLGTSSQLQSCSQSSRLLLPESAYLHPAINSLLWLARALIAV